MAVEEKLIRMEYSEIMEKSYIDYAKIGRAHV